jgi:hypothetical protein
MTEKLIAVMLDDRDRRSDGEVVFVADGVGVLGTQLRDRSQLVDRLSDLKKGRAKARAIASITVLLYLFHLDDSYALALRGLFFG